MLQDLLFVYGTLKKSQNKLHPLLKDNVSYLGIGLLPATLYDIGGYPGAVLCHHSKNWVTGEVYAFYDNELLWDNLDDYEECSSKFPEPHEYKRQKARILLANGEPILAWVYCFNRSVSGLTRIVTGEWIAA